MQKQPQLPYSMTAPSDYRRKWGSSTPHRERSYCSNISETTGGRATATVTTPSCISRLARQPLSHTASRQRREATASVIASGHENGERDRGTAIGHSDHPGEHAKATAATGSGNSHDWSRQSDLGGAASGQKTATSHPETTKANAMKPLAVQKPPTTAQGKTANETIHAHSVTTAQPSTESGAQDRSREPSNQERAQGTFPSQRSGSQGGNLTGAELGRLSRLTTSQSVQRRGGRGNREQRKPPKTLPPHHLAGRAEMRRENQPGQIG